MKKEKLFKNKKRGQGFAEYALLAAGVMIVIALAVWAFRDVFINTGAYIRCVLIRATRVVGDPGNPTSVDIGTCSICFKDPVDSECLGT